MVSIKHALSYGISSIIAIGLLYYYLNKPNEAIQSEPYTFIHNLESKVKIEEIKPIKKNKKRISLGSIVSKSKNLHGGSYIEKEKPAYIDVQTFSSYDAPLNDLKEMFTEECVGRCIYIKGDDDMITRTDVNGQEEVEFYDGVMGNCFKLKSGNAWVYVAESGELIASGYGRDNENGQNDQLDLGCK